MAVVSFCLLIYCNCLFKISYKFISPFVFNACKFITINSLEIACICNCVPYITEGNKTKANQQKKSTTSELLSTDEVLQRIQQQMAEVMASTREAVNTAVMSETDARAATSKTDTQGEIALIKMTQTRF